MPENSTPAQIRNYANIHRDSSHWCNRVHPDGLQPVDDSLNWLTDEGDDNLARLGGKDKVMERFSAAHPDERIELVKSGDMRSVLDATGLFWLASVPIEQRDECNFPNFRITSADGSMLRYWDGFICP